jgi:hypothetical protein
MEEVYPEEVQRALDELKGTPIIVSPPETGTVGLRDLLAEMPPESPLEPDMMDHARSAFIFKANYDMPVDPAEKRFELPKEVPLVMYQDGDRIVIGTAVYFAGEITAHLTNDAARDLLRRTGAREVVNQTAFSFTEFPADVIFVAPGPPPTEEPHESALD